jgi:hypothetical protein
MDPEKLQRRANSSYKEYGWTEAQIETFENFISKRYANSKNPENTSRSYLNLFNRIVLKGMKLFSETTHDLLPLLLSIKSTPVLPNIL